MKDKNEDMNSQSATVAQLKETKSNFTLSASSLPLLRWMLVIVLTALFIWLSSFFENPLHSRAFAIAALCLVLWLSEIVPSYVPTLLLWTLVPLLLSPLSGDYRLARVLAWAADPVLVLFLGGFTLSIAASRYGLDQHLARLALGWSRGSPFKLIALVMIATAVLSMWMSNIAAAAMMLAGVRPLLARIEKSKPLRRALLLSIAIGADFGGISTPIGTGPNGIAIAAVARIHSVTFLDWMVFALPLTVDLIIAGVLLISLRFYVSKSSGSENFISIPSNSLSEDDTNRQRKEVWAVLIIFLLTISAWLSEQLHGAPSGVVALAATVLLFGSGLLKREDLARIDWATLILIAGGITVGNLLEQTGLVRGLATAVPWGEVNYFVRIFLLCFASALLSALMSNTATATMLIPLAASLDSSPSTTILIAVSCSLGIPFVISTPPNAMVYGEGGLKTSDLLVPGLLLMIAGCVLISLTGRFVLNLVGIP